MIERISPLRRSRFSRGEVGARVGSRRSGTSASPSRPWTRAQSSNVVEQTVHLEVGQRELVAQPTRKERLAVTDLGKPADELDAERR